MDDWIQACNHPFIQYTNQATRGVYWAEMKLILCALAGLLMVAAVLLASCKPSGQRNASRTVLVTNPDGQVVLCSTDKLWGVTFVYRDKATNSAPRSDK